MDLFSIAAGAAGVGLCYVLYIAVTKGLPAALTWLKTKWNAGKAAVSHIEGDLAGVQTKVAAIETVTLADIKRRLAAVEAELGALKAPAAPLQPPAFVTPPGAA